MRTLQSLVTRREKNRMRMARWRARKAELRAQRVSDDPILGEWRGKFAFTITYHCRITAEFHALDFYISDKRVNSFRVHRDGELWKKQISATAALDGLRRAIPKFSLHL